MQIYGSVLGERVISMALLPPVYFFIPFCQRWEINIYRMECDGSRSHFLENYLPRSCMRREVKLFPFPQRCQTEILQICISSPLKHAGAPSAKEFIYSVSFTDVNMRSGDESPGLCLVMDFIHRDSEQGVSFILSCTHEMIGFFHIGVPW